MGRGGPLVGQEGWADLLQGGDAGDPWGRWGKPWVPSLSRDVTGHIGPFVVGSVPRVLLLRWQCRRKGREGFSGVPDSPCGSQTAGR